MGEESFHNKTPQGSSQGANASSNGTQDLEELAENLEINEEIASEINEDDLTPEEFQRLDHQLDELFSALDDIESKNDSIHSQLLLLLQENREIRKQLQNDNRGEEGTDDSEQGPASKNEV